MFLNDNQISILCQYFKNKKETCSLNENYYTLLEFNNFVENGRCEKPMHRARYITHIVSKKFNSIPFNGTSSNKYFKTFRISPFDKFIIQQHGCNYRRNIRACLHTYFAAFRYSPKIIYVYIDV